MREFQPLIEEHEEVYRIINNLRSVMESTDKFRILDEIKSFQGVLNEIIDAHFSSEERILFPKLPSKDQDESSPLDCVLEEHKEIIEKKEIFSDLLRKYEEKPENLAYEALIEIVKDISDRLYNHAYGEDTILFAFAGIVLSDEEKNMVAKDLAKISCECCSKFK